MTDGVYAGPPGSGPPGGSPAGLPGPPGAAAQPMPEVIGEKRTRDEEYGPNKRMAGAESSGPETVYRLLCDQGIVGGIIGRGGENISAVQRNTGAFIQAIQEAPPHCLERVIVISGPKDVPLGEQYNSAQKALFEMFEQQLKLDRSTGGPVLRMLICATQAGSLIGKSGVTIKELKDNSGVGNIKVLQPNDLPPCGLASDKLLHITGDVDSLRRVLDLASTRLRDSPPKELPSQEPCQNAFPPRGGAPVGPPGAVPYAAPPGAYGAPPVRY